MSSSVLSLLTVWKSGKEVKDAAKARLNREELSPSLEQPDLEALQVLARNIKDDDRYELDVTQLLLLGL